MSELKPCPFCGSKAKVWQDMYGFYLVQCTRASCSITTLHKPNREKVVEAWNRRVTDGKEISSSSDHRDDL